MSKPTLLPSKHLVCFAITGVGSTLVHVAISLLLIEALASVPTIANGVAFCLATIFSYVVNTRWSFSAPLRGKNFIRFISVAALGFFLAISLAWFAEYIGWSPIAGIGLVISVVPCVSYALHKTWTYKNQITII